MLFIIRQNTIYFYFDDLTRIQIQMLDRMLKFFLKLNNLLIILTIDIVEALVRMSTMY
jgi:hypothetical protein